MGQIFPYPDSTRGPNLARLLNGFFFSEARTRPCGLHGPCGLWYFRAYSVAQLKKKMFAWYWFSWQPNRRGKRTLKKTHYFLSNQQIWTIRNQQNPLFSQQSIDRKPFFFSLQYFPTSKVKTRINIQTLGSNNKTLQNQIKQADPIQPK